MIIRLCIELIYTLSPHAADVERFVSPASLFGDLTLLARTVRGGDDDRTTSDANGSIMQRPLFLRAGALTLLVLLGACTRLERLALPDAQVTDSHWQQHDAASSERVDHAAWDRFLARYVVPDATGVALVDYGAVTPADRGALDAYLDRLYATRVTALNRDEQLAYWVNLYNARTVAVILEHYPVATIRDIKFGGGAFTIGPWNEPLVTVEARALSLNDVEHEIIRPIWRDPRIHYVVNCAAIGCPNLGRQAYRGATIDAQMTAAARAYVNDPRGASIDDAGRLTVSKIYVWFEEDFGGSQAGVLAELARYAEPELKARLAGRSRIDGYEYDWSLNDAAAVSDTAS